MIGYFFEKIKKIFNQIWRILSRKNRLKLLVVQKLKSLPKTQGKISKNLKFTANPLPYIWRKISQKEPGLGFSSGYLFTRLCRRVLLVTTGLLSFKAKMLKVFFQNTWVFSQSPQFFSKTLEFWRIRVRYVGKKLCLLEIWSKSTKHGIVGRSYAQFWLIYSKKARNEMTFEIHFARFDDVLA